MRMSEIDLLQRFARSPQADLLRMEMRRGSEHHLSQREMAKLNDPWMRRQLERAAEVFTEVGKEFQNG